MPNATSPQATADDTTLSFDQGVEDIANLLDPETPDLPEDQDEAPDASGEQGDEPGPDDVEANADEQQDDGSELAARGRFVSGDAKWRLEDGTVITVSDLARNNLFQRDYTRKTEEVKTEREKLRSEQSTVGEVAKALQVQRDFILSVAKELLPQQPDTAMLQTDPIGYMQIKAEFDQKVGLLNQLWNQNEAEKRRLESETTAKSSSKRGEEAQKLLGVMPEFKDRKVYDQFRHDAYDLMTSKYGFSAEEVAGFETDHRFFPMVRDLKKLAAALKKDAKQVRQDVQKKPQLMTGGTRTDPKARTSREAQQRTERLRKTGDFDAGVASLMDLNL